MIRRILIALLSVVLAANMFAEEPKELQAAKSRYAQVSPHPSEADREHYVTSLARLRDKFAKDKGNTGWQAVDAEIRRHPAPKEADSKALSALRLGQWASPRHDYLYRKDGTWTMLPIEGETTHGRWHIEGNQYFDSASVDLPQKSRYTLILLNAKDFIFTDGEVVFYETRMAK